MENNNSLISIIVPVYKVEKYLRRCVDSIITQTYKNLEIILVDDGSPDTCPQICDEYKEKDSRVKVIHKPNGGLSDARNVGIDIATGDYLLFVDSDDYIHIELCERLVINAKKHNADISFCEFKYVCDDTIIINERLDDRCEIIDGNNTISILYRQDIPAKTVAWAKLYNKNLFEKLRYPVGKIHEDEYVIHYLYDLAKVVVYSKAQMYYYLINRKDSIMRSKFSIKRLDVLPALEDRLDFIKNKYPEYTQAEINSCLGMIANTYITSKKGKADKSILLDLDKRYNDLYKELLHKSWKRKLFRYNKLLYQALLEIKNKNIR